MLLWEDPFLICPPSLPHFLPPSLSMSLFFPTTVGDHFHFVASSPSHSLLLNQRSSSKAPALLILLHRPAWLTNSTVNWRAKAGSVRYEQPHYLICFKIYGCTSIALSIDRHTLCNMDDIHMSDSEQKAKVKVIFCKDLPVCVSLLTSSVCMCVCWDVFPSCTYVYMYICI